MNYMTHLETSFAQIYESFSLKQIDEIVIMTKLRELALPQNQLSLPYILELFCKYGLDTNQLLASKLLLKNYFNSPFKGYPDELYYGDCTNADCEQIARGLSLNKGLFSKLLERMELLETKSTFIGYLQCMDTEIPSTLVVTSDEVLEVLFREFDTKYGNAQLIDLS